MTKFRIIHRNYLGLLLMIYILSGCNDGLDNLPVYKTANLDKPTNTFIPMQAKSTPVNQATQSPIENNSTQTPSEIPTYTGEQREILVQNLLETNAECLLPCWWGIEPGKTTWEETERFITKLGGVTSVFQQNGKTIFHTTGGFDINREYIYNDISFFEIEDVIVSIEVHGFGYENPSRFKELWAKFAPENIIPVFGTPSRIWVQSIKSVIEGNPGPTIPYDLWVFYDQQGILIRYQGQVAYQETYNMCPTFQDDGNLIPAVDLYLKSTELNIPLENLTDYDNITKQQIIPLVEAANMSQDDFYSLYNQNIRMACFTTPRDIWP